MQISIRQINQTELSAFVAGVVGDGLASGEILSYALGSGFFGYNVVWASGGSQVIDGFKTFVSAPFIPYSGGSGAAVSRKYAEDYTNSLINNLSGYGDIFLASIVDNNTFSGVNTFINPVFVATPTDTGHATNLAFIRSVSGYLQNQLDNITVSNAVNLTSDQLITGVKTFVSSPIVPTPSTPLGAVNKAYVDSLQLEGYVTATGKNETIFGIKTFNSSPIVPTATQNTQAVNFGQLNAATFNSQNATGYSVTNINGVTGAILTQGAGTVYTYMCGNILYISGYNPEVTNLFGVQIPLVSGATGVNYIFGNPFATKPIITYGLEVSAGAVGFLRSTLYAVSSGGFSIAFETGIPNNNYLLNIEAVPVSGQSGVFGLQGPQGSIGPSFNNRGPWQAGVTYSPYDFVYVGANTASYTCYSGHNSDIFNQPAGTGNAFWSILTSGSQGAVGPTGAIGYYLNSGIVTGNFVNVSFFLEPVATGLNLAETWVGTPFTMTGFALGCIESGAKPFFGGILSGNIYVRSMNNSKTIIRNFTFDTGQFSFFSGGFAQTISGMYRLGVDVTNTMSGISRFSIGMFGF